MVFFRCRFPAIGIAFLTLLGIAGCAEDDSGRRFANQPVETAAGELAPTTAVAPPQAPPEIQAATPVSVDQLLGAVGQAQTLFVSSRDRVMAYSVADPQPREVFRSQDGEVLALAGSPNGAVAAVLVRTATGAASFDLHFVSARGERLRSVSLSETLREGRATPVNGTTAGAYDLAWSPDGKRLAVAMAAGGIVEVGVNGDVRTLLENGRITSPRQVAWSPAGNAIAFLFATPEGATGLSVAATNVRPLDPAPVIDPVEGRSRGIVDVWWPSGGNDIFFTERAANGDLSIGGDLFAVPAFGGNPRLVASSGIATPISAVGHAEFAGDGLAVAFSVIAPGERGVGLDSLWVKQRNGPTAARVPMEPGADLKALAWSPEGLIWVLSRFDASGEPVEVFQRLAPDGTVVTLSSPSDAPATPVASPDGAPQSPASPIASPPPA